MGSLSRGAWTLVTSHTSSQESRPPPGSCGSDGRRCPLLSGVAALSTPVLLVERGLCMSPALGPPGQADEGTPGPLLQKQVLGDSGSYLHAVPVQTDGRERGEDMKFFSNGFIWIEFTHHKMNLSVYRSVGFSVFMELPGQHRRQIPECSHHSSKTPPTLYRSCPMAQPPGPGILYCAQGLRGLQPSRECSCMAGGLCDRLCSVSMCSRLLHAVACVSTVCKPQAMSLCGCPTMSLRLRALPDLWGASTSRPW